MKKSAILVLSLGPILAVGCTSSKPSSPSAAGPTVQPSTMPAVASAPATPAAEPAKPAEPPKPVTAVVPPAPSAPATPPPAAPWDGPVDGRPVYMKLLGEGVQIYECKKTDTGFAWELKGAEALLYNDKGRNVGKLTAAPAPTWVYSDGSKVVGEKIASSPHEGTIPSLLLKVTSETGKGKLELVKYVKRDSTWGGTAPTMPADADHVGKEEHVQYRATYVFYAGS
jgi:hypothetical protein